MRNLLLAMLTAGIFVFGWTNCVNSLTAANATPITKIEEPERGHLVGKQAWEVIQILGPPTDRGKCQLTIPTGNNQEIQVMGDGAQWHYDGEFEGKFTHYIREMCAVYGVVVSDAIDMLEATADGEATTHMGYTDYELIRKLLEDGPDKDGKPERYILRPGEIEI